MSTRFFFFQAEDGIRDIGVTGVQTCALPISEAVAAGTPLEPTVGATALLSRGSVGDAVAQVQRRLGIDDDGIFGPITEGSEERRVGEGCRARWSPHP